MLASSVPQWISAIGGSASLLLALGIIMRDRSRAQAAQASQVVCWRHLHLQPQLEPTLSWGVPTDELRLHNASDRPITEVAVMSRRVTDRELRRCMGRK